MKKRIEFTTEMYNDLIEVADRRNLTGNVKGKRAAELKLEFVAGAIRVIDFLNGDSEKSCLPAYVYVDALRGNELKKRTEEKSQEQTNTTKK